MKNNSERLLDVFNRIFKTKYMLINIAKEKMPEWDSMKHAELIIELQKEFKMKFDIEDVLELKNLEDFLPMIRQ
ncbi:MAG: acyl carrier protein [Bacteriovorax sp.]|nr:acyl carrier protein [Bacteriovorax sp.]